MLSNEGFYAVSDLIQRVPLSLVPKCGACGLYKTCKSPKMPLSGKGKRKVLIVGEAPGEKEDERNKPFVGPSGYLLEQTLYRLDFDMREDCWIYNSLICRPPDNKIPSTKVVEWCRPNVIRIIQKYKPRVVILLGAMAVSSVIGWLWQSDVGKYRKWVGLKIPSQSINAWVCPTWHPSYLLRSRKNDRDDPILSKQFEQHLKRAMSLERRPWKDIPNYLQEVKVCFNPQEAAHILDYMRVRGKPVAFDYETDRLKPDHKDSNIVSCAFSDGETTIAYPWRGEVIEATRNLLQSEIPKIGWNLKFEERWTRKILGIKVNNWKMDGMLATHAIDNRLGNKGLDFQAFVQLGMGQYDNVVESYMKSDNGNSPNRVREIGLQKLLEYNGLDALLEYKIGLIHAKRIGIEL